MSFLSKLHPDDVLFFTEVREAMFRVAKSYELPLRSIEPYAMPEKDMADRLGDCSFTGDIRLVFRATVDGTWCEAPRSPESVWATAAHELAHLRHFNHGKGHQEYTLEMLTALRNLKEDHRDKVIKRLVKLQAQAESERTIGNTAAAEAFAGLVNKMLIENELNPTDIDYARTAQSDPVIELPVDLGKYRIETVGRRVAWQETLARVVSNAHLCTFLLRPKSNAIWFVGTKSHALVAEFVYGTLVPAAEKMSHDARRDFRNACRKACNYTKMDGFTEAYGYREAWLDAFVNRISERLTEARKAAVKEAVDLSDAPGAECTALVRLDGALAKVRKYIDDKFTGKRRSAATLTRNRKWNDAGHAAGRAAADSMAIGRRGVTAGASPRGLLG